MSLTSRKGEENEKHALGLPTAVEDVMCNFDKFDVVKD